MNPTTPLPRPMLPRLGRAEARCRRQLHRGQAPLSFNLGQHALTLSPAAPREAAMAGVMPVRLQLRLGDGAGTIGFSHSLVRLLLDLVAPGLPADHPDMDLLLEAALAAPLATLEQLFGQSIALLSTSGKLPADLLVIGLRVNRGQVPLGLAVLRLGTAEAAMLAESLNHLPPQPTPLGWLPFGVAVEAGSASLSVGALRQLRRGDIVLTDETLPKNTARIVIAGQHGLTGRKVDKGYQIITAVTGQSQGPTSMEHTQEKPSETTALDDLTVQIVFEAARLELPLGELQKIRPGYVLELDRPANLTIDLMVRGQSIGKAELVQIENTLGARIVRLFQHD